MAGGQRDRQRKIRQARAAALAAEARRKAGRRRAVIGAVVTVAVVAGAFGAVAVFSGGGGATGKKCVAASGPFPTGAPKVPVKVGSPPKKLVTKDLKVGTGAVVAAGDTVTANYIGVGCFTGKVFDSSYSRGQPSPFPLTNVIPGWQEGIPGMKVGGQRLLGIPADKAYGSSPPQGSSIGVNEPLWFVVEVVDTKPGGSAGG